MREATEMVLLKETSCRRWEALLLPTRLQAPASLLHRRTSWKLLELETAEEG